MLRQIASNTLAQLVAKFLASTLALATTIFVARLGGPDLFGNLTKVLALVAIGATAIDFGLNAAAVRQMGSDSVSQARHFRAILTLRLLLALLVILLLNGVVRLLPGGYTFEVKHVFFVASLALVFHALSISTNALFQRRLEYWRSTFATTLGALTVTILSYLSLLTSPSLGKLVVASTLGYAVTGLTSLALSGISLRPLPSQAWKLLQASLWLGATLILSILASRTDMIILGVLRPSLEVAEYGLSYRVFEVLLTLPTFVMNAVYPLLINRSVSEHSRLVILSSRALLALGALVALVGYFLAPLLPLIRSDFAASVTLLRLLLLSLPFFFVTSPLMWALIARRKERVLFGVYLVAALGNAGLNLLLVPHFGAIASALVTGATEAFILLALLYYSRQ